MYLDDEFVSTQSATGILGLLYPGQGMILGAAGDATFSGTFNRVAAVIISIAATVAVAVAVAIPLSITIAVDSFDATDNKLDKGGVYTTSVVHV